MDLSFVWTNVSAYSDVKMIKYWSNCNKLLNTLFIPILFSAIIKKYDNDWDEISAAIIIKQSFRFIRQFQDNIHWCFGSWHNDKRPYQHLNIEFIREFQSRVDWWDISRYQALNENDIREFQHKVYWYNISYHQDLGEDFIREFKDKIHWDFVFQRIPFSKKFIIEFLDRVNWENLPNYMSSNKDLIFALQK